jgi:hypothetical protein
MSVSRLNIAVLLAGVAATGLLMLKMSYMKRRLKAAHNEVALKIDRMRRTSHLFLHRFCD